MPVYAKQVNCGLSVGVFLLLLPLLSGCAPVGGGPKVLTAPELAAKIFKDVNVVASAVDQYRSRFGEIPPTTKELLASGIIAEMPRYPDGLGGGVYAVRAKYDNMDGVGEFDDTVYTGDQIPVEVCREFNLRYATPPLNTADIFDYQSVGNKYPGEVHGRQIRTYAIKWQTASETCEIDQVLRYND